MSRRSSPTVRRHRLRPPSLGPEDVDRPRLSAAIQSTPAAGTCVLSGPPGYGATTAVVQALVAQPSVAWTSLDEFDTAPGQLVAQIAAAASVHSDVPAPPTPTGMEDTLSVMAPLVEWLERAAVSWVVIDGLDSEVHEALLPSLAYLVANLPPSLRVAITTHDSPRCLPVAVTDRRLVLIEQDQLRATDDEATRIALAAAPDLDIDSVDDIAVAARGWVSAIRLAARHAARHPSDNAGHWLSTRGAHEIVDPWLAHLSAERREFLEATAFLDRLAAPVCDAVLGRKDSLSRLEDLELHGGYVVADVGSQGDGDLRWWRRHPLLTAALSRGRNAESADRDLRAAAWFQERGDLESTMRHLLAAGRMEQAVDALKGNENGLFERGKASRIAQWYASLPPDAWGQLGSHLLRVGWAQAMSLDTSSATATLAQLRAHLATSRQHDAHERFMSAEVATLAAYVSAVDGDTGATATSARSAIDLFSEDNFENSQQIAPILLIRALLWQGDDAGARRELTRIRFQPFPSGVLRETAISALQAQCLLDEGQIHQARPFVAQGLQWLSGHGLTAQEAGQFGILTSAGALALEQGEDCAAAATQLETAAQEALSRRSIGEGANALIWLARARLALGELRGALETVQTARRVIQESAPTSSMLQRIDLTEAFIRSVGGDAVRAERLLLRAPSSDARTLLWARVAMHRQANAVRRTLSALDTPTPRLSVEKQLLLAMITLKRGRALAEGHLLRAADIADASGLTLALVGFPDELLEVAGGLAERVSHDHLGRMVKATGTSVRSTSPEGVELPPVPVISGPPLSAGELQLIAYLPRRDSNADIARHLGISTNTVKTRLYRLYKKLGVDTRDGAVNVARARGLLPAAND